MESWCDDRGLLGGAVIEGEAGSCGGCSCWVGLVMCLGVNVVVCFRLPTHTRGDEGGVLWQLRRWSQKGKMEKIEKK